MNPQSPVTITYDDYLDRVLGGWIGKCLGGTIGARFEGRKDWIEIEPADLFPPVVPPNDDLDLQVLWLKVLEERGEHLTSEDLAAAWLQWCWYPFNEYGIFRRNWRIGIAPPASGAFDNVFWETGMGCAIRAELWGYVCPGAPQLAAEFARRDGALDHTAQAVGSEMMLSAMISMAFFEHDLRKLLAANIHYLPRQSVVERLTLAAFDAYDAGLSPRQARERLFILGGHPEACDVQMNVPFTFLALLYGQGDMKQTLLAALRCGYDTDCTMATAAAMLGQILGAGRIDKRLKDAIGDDLVMGIAYRRDEMTLSALARDTARIGVLLSREYNRSVHIVDAPDDAGTPLWWKAPAASSRPAGISYYPTPAAGPGQRVRIQLEPGESLLGACVSLVAPVGWTIEETFGTRVVSAATPVEFVVAVNTDIERLPAKNCFKAIFKRQNSQQVVCSYEFGVAGAALWRPLAACFDVNREPPEDGPACHRAWQHHDAELSRKYLAEPDLDCDALAQRWQQIVGSPGLWISPTMRFKTADYLGLRGACCVYLDRKMFCPEDRDVYLIVGNSDPYRIYLNGLQVAEDGSPAWWTPFNGVWPVRLRRGVNHLLVKLVGPCESMIFSLGVRHRGANEARDAFNQHDWCIDLADVNPLAAQLPAPIADCDARLRPWSVSP